MAFNTTGFVFVGIGGAGLLVGWLISWQVASPLLPMSFASTGVGFLVVQRGLIMARQITKGLFVLLLAIGTPGCEFRGAAGAANNPSMPSLALTADNNNTLQPVNKERAQQPTSPPEKLMEVVLKCDQEFVAIPLNSFGVDVVNLNGKGTTAHRGVKLMTFACLPGGLVDLEIAKRDPFLLLDPEDDGKILQLKFDGPVLYKNDCPCYVTFEEASSSNDKTTSACMGAIVLAKKQGRTKGLLVHISPGDASLPAIRALRGSGAGIFMNPSQSVVSKEFVQSLGDVEPRLLALDGRIFAELKDRLVNLESLILVDSGETLPDLSPLKNLHHLWLITSDKSSDKGKAVIDLKGLENAKQLKSLSIVSPKVKNSDSINSLSELQFLFVASTEPESPELPSTLENLRNLRYLGGVFPKNTDFSFAEQTPHLQTLCILEASEQTSFKPLEKLKSLRCLALTFSNGSQANAGDVSTFQNAQDFMKARPDVDVVPYQGICLGSLWLLPLTGIAAIAAGQIRHRRLAGRVVV
jgi:hypothetical protein